MELMETLNFTEPSLLPEVGLSHSSLELGCPPIPGGRSRPLHYSTPPTSPDIPVPYLTHIDVVEAGLEVLEVGKIKSATVESLRFMNNKIRIIDDDLFE